MIGKSGGSLGKWSKRADMQHYQDMLAATADYVRSNQALSGAVPITFTLDAQSDCPRSITWRFDTHAQITAFTLQITAVDARGNSQVETFTQANGWSGETSRAYATITSVILTARTGTGAGDTADIGIGSKVGLKRAIIATSDVFKVKKKNADYPAASYTVSPTYGTVDLSTGGAITGGDDFTIWYKGV